MSGTFRKNVLWSTAGLVLPLCVAALSVPIVIDRVGVERFGFLALAWGLIGYAGLLDLGIGRAVTRRVAALRAVSDSVEIARVFRGGVRVTWVAGLVGGALLIVVATSGIDQAFSLTDVTRSELLWSMAVIAVALPAQALSATYRGVNEAYEKFAAISVLRIFLGVVNFGGPFLVTFFTNSLVWLVSTVVISRIAALFFYRAFALRCLPTISPVLTGSADRRVAVDLLSFGGWFTVSNILSPLMVQADRFFIGVLISASAVTYYVLPYEIAVQSLVLVGALTTVLFPALSTAAANNPQSAHQLYRRSLLWVGTAMFLLMSVLALIFPWLLNTWLGDRVSADSVLVGQILCVGVFLNSLGAICFSFLHAHGKARTTAIAHLVEAPIFIVVLYICISSFGVVGAAFAWVFRVLLDTSILFYLASRLSSEQAADD